MGELERKERERERERGRETEREREREREGERERTLAVHRTPIVVQCPQLSSFILGLWVHRSKTG